LVRHASTSQRSGIPVGFLCATYLPALVFLTLSVGLHVFDGIDFGLISRDPAQEFTHLHPDDYHRMTAFPLIGFQSTVSGLIWFTAFGICLLALALARRDGQLRTRTTAFLAAMGALTLMLGADDVFMIHDELAPRYLKVLEEPFIVLYVVSIAAVLVVFRRTILRLDPILFVLAVGCLAGSIVVDHFQEQLAWWPYRIFFEDGFKFLGIVGWCGYLIRQCWFTIITSRLASPIAAQQSPRRVHALGRKARNLPPRTGSTVAG
jgi:hypothetical protein